MSNETGPDSLPERLPRYADVIISLEMIQFAARMSARVKVRRTQASPIDGLVGILGELAFAEWFRGSWADNQIGASAGEIDFSEGVEVKTSAFPYSDRLNLLVREDYAWKRTPPAYVQVILCVDSPRATSIAPGTTARLAGWIEGSAIRTAPLRDFGSKFGTEGGYRCHYVQIKDLQSMHSLRAHLA